MREREKELKELDRDTRTVFAYNLNLKADERDLFDFFSGAGEVWHASNLGPIHSCPDIAYHSEISGIRGGL